MVIFGGVAVLACPLTLDYQSVLELLDSSVINMTRVDGTAIGDAVITSVNHLKDSKAKSKVIILLRTVSKTSDGCSQWTRQRRRRSLGCAFTPLGPGRAGWRQCRSIFSAG